MSKTKKDRNFWKEHRTGNPSRLQPDISFAPIAWDVIYWPGREVYFSGTPRVFTRRDITSFTEEEKLKIMKNLKELENAEKIFQEQLRKNPELFSKPNIKEYLIGETESKPDFYPEGYDIEKNILGIKILQSTREEYETLEIILPNGKIYEYKQPIKFVRGVAPEIGKKYFEMLSLADNKYECWPIEYYDVVEMQRPYPLARTVVPEEIFFNIWVPGKAVYDDEIYVTGKVVERNKV